MLCCFTTDRWYIEHTGFTGIKKYDKNKINYCKCLDCCTWCLEFRFDNCYSFTKDINCYLCCCSIYFT